MYLSIAIKIPVRGRRESFTCNILVQPLHGIIRVAWNLTQGEFLQDALIYNILLHCKGFATTSPARLCNIKVY